MKDKKTRKGLHVSTLILFILMFILSSSFSATIAVMFQEELDIGYKQAFYVIEDFPLYYPQIIYFWHIHFAQTSSYSLIAQTHPGLYISIMSILVGTILGTVAFARILAIFRGAHNKNLKTQGLARWAKDAELDDYMLYGKTGVVLAQTNDAYYTKTKSGVSLKRKGRLIIHDTDAAEHILVAAPTRSGKGVGVIIPTLLTWIDSVVVLDIKGENWDITSGFRSQFSHTYRYQPTSPEISININPLDAIQENRVVADALLIAETIIPEEKGHGKHFSDSARNLFAALIVHIVSYKADDFSMGDEDIPALLDPTQPRSLATISQGIDDVKMEFVDVCEVLQRSPHNFVSSAAAGYCQTPDNEAGSILSSMRRSIIVYRDPSIATCTNTSSIDIAQLTTEKHPVSLYLCAPARDLERVFPLYNLIITFVLHKKQMYFESGKTTDQHKLLFLLDEFPMLGKNQIIEKSLAFSAGFGIKYLIITQSFVQLDSIYGEQNAFRDNTRIKLVYASGNHKMAREISEALGKETLLKESTSISGDKGSVFLKNISTSTQELGRALLTPDQIMALDNDTAILLISGGHPALAKKVRYFCDPRFLKNCNLDIIVDTVSSDAPKAEGNTANLELERLKYAHIRSSKIPQEQATSISTKEIDAVLIKENAHIFENLNSNENDAKDDKDDDDWRLL